MSESQNSGYVEKGRLFGDGLPGCQQVLFLDTSYIVVHFINDLNFTLHVCLSYVSHI